MFMDFLALAKLWGLSPNFVWKQGAFSADQCTRPDVLTKVWEKTLCTVYFGALDLWDYMIFKLHYFILANYSCSVVLSMISCSKYFLFLFFF